MARRRKHLPTRENVTLTTLAKNHGPIMSLRHGANLMVVGSSRAAAREILKAHDRVLWGRFLEREFKIKGSKLHNISIGFGAFDTFNEFMGVKFIERRG